MVNKNNLLISTYLDHILLYVKNNDFDLQCVVIISYNSVILCIKNKINNNNNDNNNYNNNDNNKPYKSNLDELFDSLPNYLQKKIKKKVITKIRQILNTSLFEGKIVIFIPNYNTVLLNKILPNCVVNCFKISIDLINNNYFDSSSETNNNHPSWINNSNEYNIDWQCHTILSNNNELLDINCYEPLKKTKKDITRPHFRYQVVTNDKYNYLGNSAFLDILYECFLDNEQNNNQNNYIKQNNNAIKASHQHHLQVKNNQNKNNVNCLEVIPEETEEN